MTKSELETAYFDWLCGRIMDRAHVNHTSLLHRLHQINFTYTIPMDGNREADGIDLRYHFGTEKGLSEPMVAGVLDIYPCSVLEMLVALSVKCEEKIMCDPDIGDRTYQWFWGMIENLGLDSMNNDHIDISYIDEVILRLLNHEYAPDGTGGLFTIKNCQYDLRGVEIWYQLCWYLNTILGL